MNLRLCSLALLGLASAGFLRADTFREPFDETRPLNAGGRVEVNNTNGSITVRTWDRNEVQIKGEKDASDPDTLKQIHIEIDATPDAVVVTAKEDDHHWLFHWHRSEGVRFELMVPASAHLDGIHTVNGPVDIAGVAGPVGVRSVNGAVHVTGLGGSARISTVNGAVHAEFATAAIHEPLSFSTVNGAITVLLPRSAEVQAHTSTVNGHVTCDFPYTSGRHSDTAAENTPPGAIELTAHTVNGAVTIRATPDKT